jgi:acetyltransferase-like isoleucine patch superfamily enzyme
MGAPLVTMAESSSIAVGDRTMLISVSEMTALGVNHPVILRTLSAGAKLEIGSDVGVSGATICAMNAVQIGDQCLIGANATIVDTDFHPVHHPDRRHATIPGPDPGDAVTIGRNAFIGAGAFILPGTVIGDDAVVGAGAVVKGHVPPGGTVAGNPARPVDDR